MCSLTYGPPLHARSVIRAHQLRSGSRRSASAARRSPSLVTVKRAYIAAGKFARLSHVDLSFTGDRIVHITFTKLALQHRLIRASTGSTAPRIQQAAVCPASASTYDGPRGQRPGA